MAARILDVADAAASHVRTIWGPMGSDAVTRTYGPDVGLTEDDPQTLIAGRQVYVFPASYANPELASRAEMDRRYVIAILAIERYTAAAGGPPKAWMDERVTFVEQKIYLPLRDPELVLLGQVIPDLETAATVDVVYDLDLFLTKRTFWSQATLTFQEIE